MVFVAVPGGVGFTSSGLWCGVAGCSATPAERLGQDQLEKQRGLNGPRPVTGGCRGSGGALRVPWGAVAILSAAATV